MRLPTFSVADFSEYPLAGRPAIARHDFGSGTAHYIATRPGEDALPDHLRRILNDAGVHPDHPASAANVRMAPPANEINPDPAVVVKRQIKEMRTRIGKSVGRVAG